MGRDNISKFARILDYTWGKALVDIVFEVERSLRGNLLTKIPAKVVDWDLLGRSNDFGVAKTLVWVSKSWAWRRALAGIVFGTKNHSKANQLSEYLPK